MRYTFHPWIPSPLPPQSQTISNQMWIPKVKDEHSTEKKIFCYANICHNKCERQSHKTQASVSRQRSSTEETQDSRKGKKKYYSKQAYHKMEKIQPYSFSPEPSAFPPNQNDYENVFICIMSVDTLQRSMEFAVSENLRHRDVLNGALGSV